MSGRGPGEAAWSAQTFEEWKLDGFVEVRPGVKESQGLQPVPPFRFTAEFLEYPPFEVIVNSVTGD
ncbi:MAG: hypothetical protein H0V11_09310 [Actinobacteria bacterium]|nr:hypothetical protein [Actinomycetota bacterium]